MSAEPETRKNIRLTEDDFVLIHNIAKKRKVKFETVLSEAIEDGIEQLKEGARGMNNKDRRYQDGSYAWVQARIRNRNWAWITLQADDATGTWDILNQAVEIGLKDLKAKFKK